MKQKEKIRRAKAARQAQHMAGAKPAIKLAPRRKPVDVLGGALQEWQLPAPPDNAYFDNYAATFRAEVDRRMQTGIELGQENVRRAQRAPWDFLRDRDRDRKQQAVNRAALGRVKISGRVTL